jgi:hemoglobin
MTQMNTTNTTTPTKPASLFERLGGRKGIATVVDDIVDLHMKNPLIKARFLPLASQPERLDVIKKHTIAFLEAGSGGSAQYGGRSMPDAHRGMNVSEQEFMAAVDDILAALTKNGIDAETQNDVLAIAWSLRSQILHL